MDMMILAVITIFFALVGLTDFFVGAGRWVRRTGALSGAVLAVEITSEAASPEAVLTQAADAAASRGLQGVRLVVVCSAVGENEKICQSFCRDRDIPMVTGWGDIDGTFSQ